MFGMVGLSFGCLIDDPNQNREINIKKQNTKCSNIIISLIIITQTQHSFIHYKWHSDIGEKQQQQITITKQDETKQKFGRKFFFFVVFGLKIQQNF